MKTNKISAMLLSAAIACTPVLTNVAQITAAAEETTTATTTVAETTTAAAAVAVDVPVAVDPAAAVAAADDANPAETTTTAAAAAAPSSTAATTATTKATTVENKTGGVSFDKPDVNVNKAAGEAMVKESTTTVDGYLPSILDKAEWEKAYKTNPNFNPFDDIYRFRMPDTNQGKMLYTPNPRWFINTPAAGVVAGSGESGTITWDPVPMADGYRYTIRTYVIDPSADSHTYSFENTKNGYPTAGNTANVPKSVGVVSPVEIKNAKGVVIGYTDNAGTTVYAEDQVKYKQDADGNKIAATNADGTVKKTATGETAYLLQDTDGKDIGDTASIKVMTGDLKGYLTEHAKSTMEKGFDVDRYPTKFRVKEDFTTNAKYQEQDATTGYTVKENWKEFNGVDKNLVVGYTYDLEHPSVTVSSDVPVRVEIMIQAFRIDNATGELYNLSDVSEKRVVDLNWVSKESWEGMIGAPDQYEDEFFRAGYHFLKVPEAPSKFEITWKYVTMPARSADYVDTTATVPGSNGTVSMNEHYNKDLNQGYVIQKGNGIKAPDTDNLLDTEQVKYVDLENYTETFDLKGFDPEKDKPALLDVSNQLKASKPQTWALNTSINQALTDDYNRKVEAYKEWKRQYADPITKWNTDHYEQIMKAWRTAYKEVIKAYAQSEFVNNKGYSMRYGLRDLDRKVEMDPRDGYKTVLKDQYSLSKAVEDMRIPELIISFSKKGTKDSYVVIDFQTDRGKVRTVHDKYGTNWYYENVLGDCARRGRSYALDNLQPIDEWTYAKDEEDPLASTTTSSSSSSASSSASSASGSSSGSAASGTASAGAPKTGDAGVAGLVAAASAAFAGLFVSRRKKD